MQKEQMRDLILIRFDYLWWFLNLQKSTIMSMYFLIY